MALCRCRPTTILAHANSLTLAPSRFCEGLVPSFERATALRTPLVRFWDSPRATGHRSGIPVTSHATRCATVEEGAYQIGTEHGSRTTDHRTRVSGNMVHQSPVMMRCLSATPEYFRTVGNAFPMSPHGFTKVLWYFPIVTAAPSLHLLST